jgi:predicted acetyltransferase
MKVRTATKADIEKLARMGCESFPSGFSFEERVRLSQENPRYRWEEDVLVGEENGEAVAALITIPYKVWIGGARMPMLGIAGVRNALEARRHGHASSICIAAIQRGRQSGYPISMLYPFRYDFYRKLGWGAIGELIEYNFHPRNLPDYQTRHNVRRFQIEDLEQVTACYQRFVERGTCLVERTKAVWQDWMRETEERKRVAMVYSQDGQITGYITFHLVPGESMIVQTLEVEELIYDDRQSYQGLLGFISSLRDQISTVRYRARSDEGFHHVLNDPRDVRHPILGGLQSRTGQYGISYMLRVLDIEAALTARSNYNNVTGAVSFKIRDEQIEENNRSFRFTLTDGKPEAVAAQESHIPCISLSIDLFSQLYSGAITAERADFLGQLETTDRDALKWMDRAFLLPKPFLQDQF